MFEIREIINKTEYNPLLISKQTPFTQAWFYGEWQEMMSRKVRRFEVRDSNKIVAIFQFIKYPLIFSLNFIYIPHGPILTENLSKNFWENFKKELTKIGGEENAAFIRFDSFPIIKEKSLSEYFKKVPNYAYKAAYFQPKFEWFIDLKKSEEEILGGMNPKTRYNIGLAVKRGIEIEIVSENFGKYFDDFYKLLEETAKRNNFDLHPKIYYKNIFINGGKNKNAFLAIAKYNDNILAINLILLYSGTAYFLFGGSSNEYKNLMFSRLAQWMSIKEAKTRGFEVYNFGGIGNGGKGLEGVSFFKKRFGGELFEYSDSYDLVLKSFWHRLYNLRKKFSFPSKLSRIIL